MQVDASVAKRRREFPALSKESIMNANTSFHASHPHRFANISQRDLRMRAIGHVGAIATLAALVLVAAVVSGCDPIAPVGASANAGEGSSAAIASNATARTGFDWRQADPVEYRPGDWESPDEQTTY
jgi:hypothetical protein